MTAQTEGVRLREMAKADMPRILTLEQELFPDDAWTPEMFTAELAQAAARRLYLVAEADGTVLGYAGMMFTGGPEADVVTIGVDQSFWGRGWPVLLTELSPRRPGEAPPRSCLRSAKTTPGPAALPVGRIRRDRHPARLLPAVRH